MISQITWRGVNLEFARLHYAADVLLVVDAGTPVYSGTSLVGDRSMLLAVPPEGASVRVGEPGRRQRSIRLEPSSSRLGVERVDLYPSRKAARIGMAFPGAYQRAVDRWYGVPMMVASAAGIGASVWASGRASENQRAFDSAVTAYVATNNELVFEERYAELGRARDDLQSALRLRNAAFAVTGALAAAHALDVVFRPYRGRWRGGAVDVDALLFPTRDGAGFSTVISLR